MKCIDDMEKRVLQLLQDINRDVPDNPTVNLLTAGMIDSMDMVNIITSIEKEFAVEVEAEDIVPENFDSVVAIVSLLKKYGVKA